MIAGRKFVVGDGYLKLGSPMEPRNPRLIEGIVVNQKLRKLFFLHGTGFGAYGKAGDPLFVADGTRIGEYRVNYADGTTEKVPIVYGEDVRDWWSLSRDFRVTRGEVAWEGENPFSGRQGQKIRLYLGKWKNPKPEMLILSIDYASTGSSAAAPFCFAITGEGERPGGEDAEPKAGVRDSPASKNGLSEHIRMTPFVLGLSTPQIVEHPDRRKERDDLEGALSRISSCTEVLRPSR